MVGVRMMRVNFGDLILPYGRLQLSFRMLVEKLLVLRFNMLLPLHSRLNGSSLWLWYWWQLLLQLWLWKLRLKRW